MAMMTKRDPKLWLFGGITVVCVIVAVTYVALSARRPQPLINETLRPAEALPTGPLLISLNLTEGADNGKVRVSRLTAPDTIATMTNLHCERVHFAANHGICLRRIVQGIGVSTVATLFDATFRPLFDFETPGIPSRARVAPDGRYAAFTVFVFGHSYADNQFSTATFLLETATGKSLANLEEFTVFQGTTVIDYPDFNYWGVTFTDDSNLFYATLRFTGVPYLVKGDIGARTITLLHPNVECPSLSPDETRIAFKKRYSLAEWHLTVMDLATYVETPVAETRNVDDQAEWLDNEHLLFGAMDSEPPWMSVMVVRADGTGKGQWFARATNSPAVVRP